MAIVKKSVVELYGKKIEIIFKFLKEYKVEQFDEDVKNFIKIYSNQMTYEEKGKFLEDYKTEFLFYPPIKRENLASKPIPSFDDYVKEAYRLFYMYIIRLAGDFAKSDKIPDGLKIIFYFMNGHRRGFWGGHEDPFFPNLERLKTSTPQLIVYSLNATIVFYYIFAPFYYIKRFYVSRLIKLLGHEFWHYIQFIQGNYDRELALKQRYENFGIKHLTIINELFWDMFNDGIAEFFERPYQHQVPLKGTNLLKQFKERVRYLASITNIRYAEKYYEERVDTSEQKYYWARMMTFTIVLRSVVEKKEQSFFTFYSGSKRIYLGAGEEMINKFRKQWGSKKPIKMDNLPIKTIIGARSLFEGIKTYEQFIKLYEDACDFFHIPWGSRILTTRFVRKLFEIELKQHQKQAENVEKRIDKLLEV